jgi:hypothetical protein
MQDSPSTSTIHETPPCIGPFAKWLVIASMVFLWLIITCFAWFWTTGSSFERVNSPPQPQMHPVGVAVYIAWTIGLAALLIGGIRIWLRIVDDSCEQALYEAQG